MISTVPIVCRYAVKPDAGADPAFSNYHAIASLPQEACHAIISPGCCRIAFEVCFTQTFASFAAENGNVSSVLPPRPADAGKAKPVQQPLPPLHSGKEACGWQDVTFSVEITFTRPVLPAWKPPPKPAKSLSEVLPRHADKDQSRGNAIGQYTSKLQGGETC